MFMVTNYNKNILVLVFSAWRLLHFFFQNTDILIIFSFKLPPLMSKTTLENKEPAAILSKFEHLILKKY